MGNKLTVIKNIIWALSIVICLVVMLIALVFGAATKYYGQDGYPVLYLGGETPAKDKPEASQQGEDGQDGEDVPQGVQQADGSLTVLAKTKDAGQEYIDSLTFLCDSALVGLRDYGLLSGGIGTTQVWGSSAGNIPVADIAECTIKYPNDGSQISAANAAMIAKPEILIISLGADSLAGTTREDFIYNYTLLVLGIRASSPQTTIVCCSLGSVISGYSGVDNLSSAEIGDANEWIKQVCIDTGAYFLDVAEVLNEGGYLLNKYASQNGKTLNTRGLETVLEYIRTHAVS